MTQGSDPRLLHLLCLLHWQADSLPLAPPGKPFTAKYFTNPKLNISSIQPVNQIPKMPVAHPILPT